MAWLLEITRNGEDLYPLIKQKAKEGPVYDTYAEYRKFYRQIPQVEGEFSVTNHDDMVRFELMQNLGTMSRNPVNTVQSIIRTSSKRIILN